MGKKMICTLSMLGVILLLLSSCGGQSKEKNSSTDAPLIEHIHGLDQFNNVVALSEEKLVIIDVYADWCGPCKIIAPTMQKIAANHADSVRVFKVDFDTNPDIARKLGVQGIPLVLYFRHGKPVSVINGAYPEAYYISQLSKRNFN